MAYRKCCMVIKRTSGLKGNYVLRNLGNLEIVLRGLGIPRLRANLWNIESA